MTLQIQAPAFGENLFEALGIKGREAFSLDQIITPVITIQLPRTTSINRAETRVSAAQSVGGVAGDASFLGVTNPVGSGLTLYMRSLSVAPFATDFFRFGRPTTPTAGTAVNPRPWDGRILGSALGVPRGGSNATSGSNLAGPPAGFLTLFFGAAIASTQTDLDLTGIIVPEGAAVEVYMSTLNNGFVGTFVYDEVRTQG